jgi:hypothetical protein
MESIKPFAIGERHRLQKDFRVMNERCLADGKLIAPFKWLGKIELHLIRERPLNPILRGLVFSRVLFPRIQEFNCGKFKAFVSG